MAVTITRSLLTAAWTADVDAVETAIERLAAGRTSDGECKVALFEVACDPDLHVNVTHKHRTRTAAGWAGPASVAEGFVHNRTFGDARPAQIVRHIRDMVFATRKH